MHTRKQIDAQMLNPLSIAFSVILYTYGTLNLGNRQGYASDVFESSKGGQ
jgi:hypothetical protein